MHRDQGFVDELHRFAVFEPDAHALFARAARLAREALASDRLIVSLGSGDRLLSRVFDGSGSPVPAPELGMVQAVAATGRERVLERLPDAESAALGGAGACAGVPLLVGDVAVGVIVALAPAPRLWSTAELATLRMLASMVAHALELQVELMRTRRNETHLASQKEVLGMIARSAPLPGIMVALANHVEHQAPGSLCAVHLRGEDGRLELMAAPAVPASLLHDTEADTAPGYPPRGPRQAALDAGDLVVLADASDAAVEFATYAGILAAHDLRAHWSAPVVVEGEVVGIIDVYRSAPGEPGPGDVELLSVATAIAGIAVERSSAEETLRQSEERYRLVSRSTNDVVWDWDLESGRVVWTEALERVYGYAAPGSDTGWWKERIHPDDLDAVLESLHTIFDSGLTETWAAEYRFRRADGSYARVVDRGLISRACDGSPRRVIGSMADTTRRFELEEQLRQAQRMEAVGRLAGGVAHDFNNLLTAMTGFAELLREEIEPEGGERLSFLTEISRAADRAAGLTGQLLAFSRQQVLQPRRVDPNAVVRDIEPMLRRLISENVRIEANLDPEVQGVWADPGQLEQVIVNLAVNARDAMPHGGVLTLETAFETVGEGVRLSVAGDTDLPPGSYVRICVGDTGHGMRPEILPNIFEPFFTTKDPANGTGLGLSTVYGIVKQSEGHIQVASEEGVGTRFTIYLPTTTEPNAVTEPLFTGDAARDGSGRVLVVEDHEAVRDLARRILGRQGYEVEGAEDGAAALALLRTGAFRPDVLLTDVVLPGMSGPEIARRVAEHVPEVRIVFMSGYADDHLGEHGIIGTDVAFLQKPFTPQGLVAIVGSVRDPAAPSTMAFATKSEALGS